MEKQSDLWRQSSMDLRERFLAAAKKYPDLRCTIAGGKARLCWTLTSDARQYGTWRTTENKKKKEWWAYWFSSTKATLSRSMTGIKRNHRELSTEHRQLAIDGASRFEQLSCEAMLVLGNVDCALKLREQGYRLNYDTTGWLTVLFHIAWQCRPGIVLCASKCIPIVSLMAIEKQKRKINHPTLEEMDKIECDVTRDATKADFISTLPTDPFTASASAIDVIFGSSTELEAVASSTSPWSKQDSPKRWAKSFGVSVDTIKRRFSDQTIRNKKLSDRSYQIHLEDLLHTHPESPHKSA